MQLDASGYVEVEKVMRGRGQGGIGLVGVPPRLGVERCEDEVHELQHTDDDADPVLILADASIRKST